MKFAIGHYHLNRGGVTRVIESQLLALDAALDDREPHEAMILYGGRSEGWSTGLADRLHRIRLRLQPIPELDYDSERTDPAAPLAQRLVDVLEEAGFSPAETVIHLHNHSIGKNAALGRAVWKLARQGYGLLLQIHDFAEDQRPLNFRLLAEAGGREDWHGRLYPQAPNVHFAVLNGRDRGVLESVGIPAGRLHFLPNPVLPLRTRADRGAARDKLEELFSVPRDRRFILYPVRGIRRKNLGEALLHSVLAPEGTIVGVTLPPLNPVERVRYDRWKTAAEKWRPPFRFEVGAPGGLRFGESMTAADGILTTSVAEGFGMVYLECWLADRALVGRDLPEITGDFTAVGVDLSRLSSRLEVPVDWIDRQHYRSALAEAFEATVAAYGRPVPDDLSEQLEAKLRDETIDFGDLDEDLQTCLMDRIVGNPSARAEILAANPWIAAAMDVDDPDLVASNAKIVRREFSLEPSGARLAAIYESVLNSPRKQHVHPLPAPERILDRFLDLARFRLLRS